MKTLAKLLILPAAILLIQACSNNSTGVDFSDAPAPFDTTQAVNKTTTDDGLIIYVIEEGAGPFEVVVNDEVEVLFTGRTKDGTIFDSSYRNGSTVPSIFRNLTPVNKPAGARAIPKLIEGFRRGILGMKIGERRTIIIPPSLGYGDSQDGTNGFNLRKDTLIFDIELDNIISP